ncbi:hypothetical protein [Hymenobacter metallicola]|uniref:Uncharacterized protein n=1 Tax=Hymenobacter metallicola TaxID=2563114 RepID=A0A4Z0QD77_9BACT|nr:hypothetical protein [Hymenobacter metallicola]TGE28007.1 hypothetical protein E5K02_00650 [Hymenobacter metallicola]
MSNARNDTSFDFFIPCKINDKGLFSENIAAIRSHRAYRVFPGRLEFSLMNVSWPSSADSFYVQDHRNYRWYLCPAELTLEDDGDGSVTTMDTIEPMRVARTIVVNQMHPGYYRITRARKIILQE